MINADLVKLTAKKLGADLCGIAPLERFQTAPAGFHPADLFNEEKSVIAIAKRFPEGPCHSPNLIPYTVTNDALLNDVVQLTCELAIALEKEDDHLIAVPVPGEPYDYWDAERRTGKGLLSLKHAGYLAGLGVFGKNSLLTNQFYGNRIVLGAVLITTTLPGDRMVEQECCPEHCRRCIEACPAQAIDKEKKTVEQKRCREYSEGKTTRGHFVYTCHTCRKICPNGKKFLKTSKHA